MPLVARLQIYRDVVQKAQDLIVSAHKTDTVGNPLWTPFETRLITESAFLRMYIAWESFIEGSITDYMLGELSILGHSVPRYVSPLDEAHANRIILTTQRYFDFADPDKVRTLSNIFFQNGEPFQSTISSIFAYLVDLRTIRNAAAHLSSTTTTSLDAAASRILKRTCNNITVYDLLLAIDPSSPAGATVLTSYLSQLDTAAQSIAHA